MDTFVKVEDTVILEENGQIVTQFDMNKICRTCLMTEGEMRSIFQTDDSISQVKLAEMIKDITNIQITSEDGLPPVICVQCADQLSSSYSFKQRCEQADSCLRQYLGKPVVRNNPVINQVKENTQEKDYCTFVSFGSDSFSKTFKDVSIKQEISDVTTSADEQLTAWRQHSEASKLSKGKLAKKKISVKPGVIQQLQHNHQCNVCKKKFVNLKYFRKHLVTHVEDGLYKCKLCPRSFTEENYLNNHMRIHMPDEQKPHECEICKKRFIHASLLNKHMKRHTGEKPFICKICKKGCYAENSLLKHMKIHENKGNPSLFKHTCDYCRREFCDATNLEAHIKQHTGDRPFLCTFCGKSFPQRFNLDLHLRGHTGEKPFSCEVCNKGYVSKASLKTHLRTHTDERPFVCDFCGKAFRQSGDLKSHKRLHGAGKPIECSICEKRFTTKMKLKYHMRNHTGERPYVCSVCNRGFTVNNTLLRHMRIHTGERPCTKSKKMLKADAVPNEKTLQE